MREIGRWEFLGRIQIRPVNQAGTGVHLDDYRGTFKLSRRSSVFGLYVMIPVEQSAPHDIRCVRLVCDKYFLGLSESSELATPIPISSSDHVGVNLELRKYVFDHIGSSIQVQSNRKRESWLRHSNSQLHVSSLSIRIQLH